MPQPPVALLMDFDGVILDSMELKTQGFVKVYAGEPPSKLAEVLAYQRLHGGVTRRTKFAYFEKSIFGRTGDNETIERLAATYRGIIYDAVLATSFVPGAEEFLRRAVAAVNFEAPFLFDAFDWCIEQGAPSLARDLTQLPEWPRDSAVAKAKVAKLSDFPPLIEGSDAPTRMP